MPFCIRYYSSKGIDLYAISKRLGNSHMTITAKTYVYMYVYMLDEYEVKKMIVSKKLSIAYKNARYLLKLIINYYL